MAEVPAPGQELKYRNVTIHSQGKTEHGTLHLLKHHALFSYQPGAKKGDRSVAHSRNVSGAHNHLSGGTPKANASNDDVGSAGSPLPEKTRAQANGQTFSESQPLPKSEPPKVRPKEIWIPYPIISYCILRPSHAASITSRPSAPDRADPAAQTGDDLFPPTFGTSDYERPSIDSARFAPISTPPRPSSPSQDNKPSSLSESSRQPVIRIRRKDFQMMALHFNSGDGNLSADETARQAFYVLRERCCVDKIQELHAFHYQAHKDEARANVTFDARREFARMGISPKAADGPGAAWRISDINHDYSYSRTYPNVLCVPKAVSDNMLKYGGTFRSKSRIPALTYLHSNGGSITRSSQPMVGLQNKRSPQDERLVSAIFSSHTPPMLSPEHSPPRGPSLTSPSSSTLETIETSNLNGENEGLPTSQSETALDEKVSEKSPVPRVYGSTRRNVIVDARPSMNVLANRATGGGIENVSNYSANSHMPTEKVYLNIENIHVMRASLDKVIESFGSADYVNMKPNAEALRKSGWLGHIAGLLSGSEMVARVVGLGGSHALVHCSDGWDRTSQVAALAQVMLDPHCRTLNGFITLVQKDFLSFGHKFRDRDGIEGCEKWFKIENERIVPSRSRENTIPESQSLNAMGQRAFTGAKNWLQKKQGNLFNNQTSSGRDSPSETPGSRSSSPPPNPLIHSPPSSTSKEDGEHKISEGEISPVFHQFLDTVFQLLHQAPNAFEFNERFLRRLFYQAYACQYGEFLFNNEKDRAQHESKLPSVWGHFLSRRQEFMNPDYVAQVEDPLLFPRRGGTEREVEVRWWAALFGRKDEEMNLPRALAPADPAPHTATAPLRASVSFEEPGTGAGGDGEKGAAENAAMKETRSTPSLATLRDNLTSSFSSMTFRTPAAEIKKEEAVPEADEKEAIGDLPLSSAQPSKEDAQLDTIAAPQVDETAKIDQMDMSTEEGDPLGVSSAPKHASGGSRGGGLDFAAFASQNAFQER